MNIASILQFLNSELTRHGAEIISAADLAALGAVERRLSIGLVDTDEARAVSWVASLTPYADRDAFRTSFGKPAGDLFDALLPTRELAPSSALPGLGRMSIRSVWAQATAHNDPVRRAVATALLAGDAEKVSNSADQDQLHRILDIAVTQARDETTRFVLSEIRDGLAPSTNERENNTSIPPLLISVSIDVVGSTEAKRRLRDLAAEQAWRVKLYEDFYANFLHAEDLFYSDLFAPGIWGHGPPLDWRRFFVVKGIGDELWLTYDFSLPEGREATLQQAAVRLISAAMALTQRCLSCGGTGEDLGPNFDPKIEERQRVDHMDLPFKVSIDLIEDAIEVSEKRLDYLSRQAGAYLSSPGAGDAPRDANFFGAPHADILRRLNAGHFELAGGHRLRQAYRTDFIGPDVDRFFRITKFALPGLVMVGDHLMRHLRFDIEAAVTTEIDRIRLLFPTDLHQPNRDVSTDDPVLRRKFPIRPDQMKGIDAAYTVHHLVQVPALRGILHAAANNPFFEPTAKAFPDNMRELITPGAINELPLDDERPG